MGKPREKALVQANDRLDLGRDRPEHAEVWPKETTTMTFPESTQKGRAGGAFWPVCGILAPGLAAAAIGLLALLGWFLDWPWLTGFGADRKPMPPSVAALFVWYGAAVAV